MKTVLVTGGSRGIGMATCIAFAKEGYNIVLNYLNSEDKALELKDTIEKTYGVEVLAIKADVSKSDEVKNMVEKAIEKFSFIDVLVNNAGISYIGLITDTDEECFDQIIATNLKSVYNASKAVLPYMINKKEGSIINVSSMWGEVGASCEVAYSTSKAGVIGFTKALSKEVGPSNIRVNCVSPGVIDTDMNKSLSDETIEELKEEISLGRIGTPKNIADMIVYLSSDKAEYITGQVFSVNGGII